jgi:phosphopantothenoylcysteine decarboxylase/phosphopantothenate--cysteine ligase
MHHRETGEYFEEPRHPSRDILGSFSSALAGKRVALGITGSVAAVKSVDVARLLMRYGADVFPVMSGEAQRLIHPNLMHWATGNRPVTELTGAIEHVYLGGNVRDKVDLVLVCPSTANTIGKAAAGIDDTPVTTLITTACGEGIPVCMVPAMHAPMYEHPVVVSNIQKLTDMGFRFVEPDVSEGKAKLPSVETIVWSAVKLLASDGPLAGKTVAVSAGRTVEYIDPIRVITNNSSGKMGIELTKALLLSGADIHLIYGKGSATPVSSVPTIRVDTAEEMANEVVALLSSKRVDCFIAAAAVGDWKAAQTAKEKISTHTEDSITLELSPTVKIIDRIKERFPETFLVAFRALYRKSPDDLSKDAASRMTKAKADVIAVNDVGSDGVGFESDNNEMRVFSKNGREYHIPFSDKFRVAERLVEIIAQLLTE